MYQNLIGLMAQKDISIETVAKVLNVHRNTVSNKLYGDSEFTYGQAETIHETFFPEYQARFLFARTKQERQ